MIQIDEEKLHTFLQEKKSKIQQKSFSVDGLFAAVTFLFSLLTIEYNKITFLSNTVVIAIFWILFIAYSVYQIAKFISVKKSEYTVEDLYNDIKRIEKGPSKFSLVIIKDCVSNNKNKILLSYDKRWKCYLLPYYRTIDDKCKDIKEVKNFVSSSLDISLENIEVEFIKEDEPLTKFSESNERTKTYIHRFYIATIKNTNKKIINKRFKVDNKKYRWFTIEEMYENRAMKKKNQDVIDKLNEMNL